MSNLRVAIVAAAFALISRDLLYSKCAPRSVAIHVHARSASTGAPVSDVELAIFVNDDPNAVELIPRGAKTDRQGSFEGSFLFDTYSGSDPRGIDRCDRRLDRLTVEAWRRDYVAKSVQFVGQQLRAITNRNGTIEVPIELVPEA